MALSKVRVQLLNETTGEVEQEVDVLTSADAVIFEDGETFQQKLDAGKLKGDKGDTGATGATGAKGDTGATGQKGSQWYSGTGITGTSTTAAVFSGSGVASALVNDMYLNTSTGAVYKCTTGGAASAAKWVYAGSIKGATGAAGAKGDTGATGATGAKGDTGATGQKGSQWYTGTGITGTSITATVFSGSGVASALVNDMYLNTSTGYVYECTVAGVASVAKWVYVGSIKGATGAKGDTGEKGEKGDKGDPGENGADGDSIKVGTSYETATSKKLFFKVVE